MHALYFQQSRDLLHSFLTCALPFCVRALHLHSFWWTHYVGELQFTHRALEKWVHPVRYSKFGCNKQLNLKCKENQTCASYKFHLSHRKSNQEVCRCCTTCESKDYVISYHRGASTPFIGFYLLWMELYPMPSFIKCSLICLIILIHLSEVYNYF